MEIDAGQHRRAGITRRQSFDFEQNRRVRGRAPLGRGRGRIAVSGGVEIGGHHGGVGGDLGWRAVGDDAALMQHGYAVGDRQHAVDVVLDQQHRMGFRQPLDKRRDDDAVGLGQPRERFVEQQQFGIDGERDGDLQQPLSAVRQIDDVLRAIVGQPHRIEDRPGALVDHVVSMRVAQHSARRPPSTVAPSVATAIAARSLP